MVDGAKFNSHNSGDHRLKVDFWKWLLQGKFIYLRNYVEVTKIKHAVTT